MKLSINREICQGHNMCTRTSAKLFESDDDGYGHVRMPDVPKELEAEARAAQGNCPEGAIEIVP